MCGTEGTHETFKLKMREAVEFRLNCYLFKANFKSHKITRVKIIIKRTITTLCFL